MRIECDGGEQLELVLPMPRKRRAKVTAAEAKREVDRYIAETTRRYDLGRKKAKDSPRR